MDFEPKVKSASSKKPLVLFKDTESWLRRKSIAAITPVLSPESVARLQTISAWAEEFFQELTRIEFKQISDAQLRVPRISIGLAFVGFASLLLLLLALYLNFLHPHSSFREELHNYWYQYSFIVSLGVSGMFVLGREAMR